MRSVFGNGGSALKKEGNWLGFLVQPGLGEPQPWLIPSPAANETGSNMPEGHPAPDEFS